MEQIDTLKNDYKIIQDTERFQFGIDAVLLADFANKGVKAGDSVIDLGTGTGIIPLLMAGKLNEVAFTGLEVQEASAEMGITTRNFWRVVNLILNSNLFVHIEQTSLKLYNYLHDNN